MVRKGRGRARLERVLGPAGSIEPVLEGLLVENGLRGDFEPYEPPEPSLEGRVDLRDQLSFTIDPETAKDFDDAISVRREGDGIRVWVHIADVSWFVPAGSPLDHGAAGRALSTYVPGTVAPMLPHEIADDLCSLRPGQDRLTVTVEVGPGGETNFYRSVIRSGARLTYGQAEAILAGTERAEPELAEALALAQEVSAELRRRRFARGALRIESPDTSFEFDGRGGVARAWRESEPAAHALIEELMILANEAVAGCSRAAAARRSTGCTSGPTRSPSRCCSPSSPTSTCRRRPSPSGSHRRPRPSSPPPPRSSSRATSPPPAAAATRSRPSSCALSSRRATTRRTSVTPGSRAPPTATSPRRSAVTRTSSSTARSCASSASPTTRPPRTCPRSPSTARCCERESASLEYLADEICLAWLLESRLFEAGWEATFEGEIVGAIGSGIFVLFDDVFEAFLPARRLPGDYFELNATRHRARRAAAAAARTGSATRSRCASRGSSARRARSRSRPSRALSS